MTVGKILRLGSSAKPTGSRDVQPGLSELVVQTLFVDLACWQAHVTKTGRQMFDEQTWRL
jgi:hypothetical protein